MPIKGLTDREQTAVGGAMRTVRLGRITKGRRVSKSGSGSGFGRDAKLEDLDYFRFVPNAPTPALEEAYMNAWIEAYGEHPTAIPDVRIPYDRAGDFQIDNHAWIMAYVHGEQGSYLLAQSDGELVRRARDAKGHMITYASYPSDGYPTLRHEDATRKDPNTGRECFVYQGKLYPWARRFQVDLILPDLNRILYNRGLAGHGLVTFGSSSTYDIAGLIAEYHGMLAELRSAFYTYAGTDPDIALRYMPLRAVPIQLIRSTDKITTPDYRDPNSGKRLHSTRSLVHWQLAPSFAASLQEAMDKRTAATLSAVANMPLLGQARTVDQINDDLFGDLPSTPQLTAGEAEELEADWLGDAIEDLPDSWDPETDYGLEDDDLPEWAQDKPEPAEVEALAEELGGEVRQQPISPEEQQELWAQDVLQLEAVQANSLTFPQLKTWAARLTARRDLANMVDWFEPPAATLALVKYLNAKADGLSTKDAMIAAAKVYADLWGADFQEALT